MEKALNEFKKQSKNNLFTTCGKSRQEDAKRFEVVQKTLFLHHFF